MTVWKCMERGWDCGSLYLYLGGKIPRGEQIDLWLGMVLYLFWSIQYLNDDIAYTSFLAAGF